MKYTPNEMREIWERVQWQLTHDAAFYADEAMFTRRGRKDARNEDISVQLDFLKDLNYSEADTHYEER